MSSGIVEPSSQGSQPQQPQLPVSRSRLVQRLLVTAADLPAFLGDLLATMTVVVAGTEAAAFIIERQGDRIALRLVAHIRPDDSDDHTRAVAVGAFKEILQPCIAQNKDGTIEVGGAEAGEPQFCLVTLLRHEGQAVAATAVITRCRDQERAKQRLQSMQLVAGYFELYTIRRAAVQTQIVAQNHQNVLQLAAAVGTAEGFESSAMNLCNELATRMGASRVSVGWLKGKNIKVQALSHTEKFDKRQDLVVGLQRAMEECADQEEPVRFDADGTRSANVSREHEALARAQGSNSVVSLPLRRKDEVMGVITLEFAPPKNLPAEALEALVIAAEVLAPQIIDRYENSRMLPVKVWHSTQWATQQALGPKHTVFKLVAAGIVAALLFVCLYKPMYHVSSPFELMATDKRTLCAPYEGVIKDVCINPRTQEKFKAGDGVYAGEVLVVMRTDDIQNKLYKAISDANSAHETALAKQADGAKVAEYLIYLEQEKGARAEARLYQQQIDDAQIKAPFDGDIVRGDLDEKKGAPVKTGDVLFEVARPGQLRAELAVAERDVQDLQKGQSVTLSTNSFANKESHGRITRIVPMGDAKDGQNTFRVFAALDGPPDKWMRSGMVGEARVDVEPRRLVWTWTHRLVDFLRLKLWM